MKNIDPPGAKRNKSGKLYDKKTGRYVTDPKTPKKNVKKGNKTHGNTLNDKPAEGYSLRDRDTGQVKKYGETTRGEDKFGSGQQKRYSKKHLKDNNVDYVKETSGTKKEMHKWQNKKIIEHKNEHGNRPGLNKNDY